MAQRRYIGGVILCLALATSIAAEPPTTALIGTPPQPGWNLLGPQQKSILAPLASEWDKIDNMRRKKWLGIAERYPSMKPDEQRHVQDRMREWAKLAPEQRAKVRDSYKEFNQLPTEQKQVVKQKWEAYSNLTPEEKQRVRQSGKSAQLLTPYTGATVTPAAEPVGGEANNALLAPATPSDAGKN